MQTRGDLVLVVACSMRSPLMILIQINLWLLIIQTIYLRHLACYSTFTVRRIAYRIEGCGTDLT